MSIAREGFWKGVGVWWSRWGLAKEDVKGEAFVAPVWGCENCAAVTGLMGGGKSYFVLDRYIVPELLQGCRTVVTNLKLKEAALREYLMERGAGSGVVDDRLRVVTDEQMCEWWRYRGRGVEGGWWDSTGVPDSVMIAEKRRGECAIADYDPGHMHCRPYPTERRGGVLYVFDEAHFGLRARDWQTLGRVGEWYLCHVRKFADALILTTPYPGDIDKYVRSRIGRLYVCSNGLGMRLLGLWRGPRRVLWSSFLGPIAEKVGSNREMTGSFPIYMDLCRTYKTEAGAGLSGGVAGDVGTKVKGLAPWTGGLVLAGLVGLAVAFPFGLGRVAGWVIERALGSTRERVSPAKAVAYGVPGLLSSNTFRPPVASVASVLGREQLVSRSTGVVDAVHAVKKVIPLGGAIVSYGVCGKIACVKTRYGVIWGRDLTERGDTVMMDGVEYSLGAGGAGGVGGARGDVGGTRNVSAKEAKSGVVGLPRARRADRVGAAVVESKKQDGGESSGDEE